MESYKRGITFYFQNKSMYGCQKTRIVATNCWMAQRANPPWCIFILIVWLISVGHALQVQYLNNDTFE